MGPQKICRKNNRITVESILCAKSVGPYRDAAEIVHLLSRKSDNFNLPPYERISYIQCSWNSVAGMKVKFNRSNAERTATFSLSILP